MLKLRNLGWRTQLRLKSRFSTKSDSDDQHVQKYPTDPNPRENPASDTNLPFLISIMPKNFLSVDRIAKLNSLKLTDFQLPKLAEYLIKKASMKELEDQSFIEERHRILGSNLASAHFVVARGGAVKFVNHDEWVRLEGKSYNLPTKFVPNLYLEAIDTTGMSLMYEGFENLTNLNYLKYLKLYGNPNIDDWFLDRLNIFKDSLEVLEIDKCPNVTERGLIILHRLRKLKMLKLGELSGVQHKELVGLLLEDYLTNCKIEGLNFTELESQLSATTSKE